MEQKKKQIINIYRYFYRFSIQGVNNFINNPIMMIFVMEYLKNTHLKRAHMRSTMKRNLNAYYKAMENLINLSQYNDIIIQLLPNIIG
jgi:RNase P protein component